jgi:hypothetical protein
MRAILALVLIAMALVAPAMAQSEEAPWQAVVTGQIEAFRTGDGVAALNYAGAGFKAQFEDPNDFIKAITAAGYGPIVASRSHSFGDYNKVSDSEVLQVVKFVGPDQGLYEALYQMVDEPGTGWRVQGVVLRREPGVGV